MTVRSMCTGGGKTARSRSRSLHSGRGESHGGEASAPTLTKENLSWSEPTAGRVAAGEQSDRRSCEVLFCPLTDATGSNGGHEAPRPRQDGLVRTCGGGAAVC